MKLEINISDELEPIETASARRVASLAAGAHAVDPATRLCQRADVPGLKFDAAGVHPDDLKSLEDLAKFPYTTKQDLRDNYPFGTFAVPMEEVVRDTRVERHDRQTDRGRLHAAGY